MTPQDEAFGNVRESLDELDRAFNAMILAIRQELLVLYSREHITGPLHDFLYGPRTVADVLRENKKVIGQIIAEGVRDSEALRDMVGATKGGCMRDQPEYVESCVSSERAHTARFLASARSKALSERARQVREQSAIAFGDGRDNYATAMRALAAELAAESERADPGEVE